MKKLNNDNKQEEQIKIIGENARKVLEIIKKKNEQEKNKDDGEER